MLRELSVQNLAIFEDARVELRPGFCAWTGETGAGKSLLLGALGLLVGERGSADLIRAGADELRVTGVFELGDGPLRAAVEQALGRPLDADGLIISRRLSRSNKSSAHVNDVPTTLAALKRIGAVLVDVHGQRETHSLLQPEYQLHLLDAFGKLGAFAANYRHHADRVRSSRKRRDELDRERQQRQRELSLLRFDRDELDRAAIRPGEMAELLRERDRLSNARSLRTFAESGCARLYDDEGSVVEQLGQVRRDANEWSEFDAAIAAVARRLEALLPEVQDLAETLRDLAARFEADPGRLEEVETRLMLIRQLEKKYGRTADELIEYRAGLDALEQALQQQEDDCEQIQAELRAEFAAMIEAAAELSRRRRKVAKKLTGEVQKQLAELGMPSAKFDAHFTDHDFGSDPLSGDIPSGGADHLELMLEANPGEPPRPLRKVASGGELSRAMLALKTVLAEHDPVGTLIFDEIDANVGGRLGDVIGRKLAALGVTHQVICVTHLPQVASYAEHQWAIRKQIRGQRSVTTVCPLDEAQRSEELAEMLRGESRGETTRAEAEAMLAAARSLRV